MSWKFEINGNQELHINKLPSNKQVLIIIKGCKTFAAFLKRYLEENLSMSVFYL